MTGLDLQQRPSKRNALFGRSVLLSLEFQARFRAWHFRYVEHRGKADDFGTGLEPLERAGLGHGGTLAGARPRLKPGSLDRTLRWDGPP